MNFKANAELDLEARLLSERMDDVAPDGVVTYTDLSSVIGRDVQTVAYSALLKARKLQKEKQRLFLVVQKVGLKLLTDSEIATTVPENGRMKMQRLAKRQARDLSCIANFDALGHEEKTRVLTAQSVVGVVAALTKPAGMKKLEQAIAGEQKALPLAKTLEAFTK